MPSVTVLMSVFNGERYLGPAIESILKQTYSDFELVIVNDGSTDGSQAIVRSYGDARIRLVENGCNLGQATALNRGLCLARGELIARQDADDLSHPERLARQVEVMCADPDLALVGTQGRVIDETGARVGTVSRCREHISIRWYHLFDNPFIHTSVIFRRAVVLDELGGYDESFPYCQDYELWSRVLQSHRALNLSDRLVDYRWHAASRTGSTQNGIGVYQQRAGFRDLLRRIIRRNSTAVFGEELFTVEVELMCGFALGVERGSLGAFTALFARLLRRYRTLYPDASISADFRETIARQYDTIAHRVSPAMRRLALRVYASAVRSDPAMAFWLSWLRALALTTVGRAGLSRLRGTWR